MRAFVVYDSMQGNTERIARSIAAGIAGGAEALRADEARPEQLGRGDLLVLGSPTHGGRPTDSVRLFMERIPSDLARRLTVATFDTRLGARFVRLFGYAAVRMAARLEERGCTLTAPPEGFVVNGRNGPLAAGETERAEAWGRSLGGKGMAQ